MTSDLETLPRPQHFQDLGHSFSVQTSQFCLAVKRRQRLCAKHYFGIIKNGTSIEQITSALNISFQVLSCSILSYTQVSFLLFVRFDKNQTISHRVFSNDDYMVGERPLLKRTCISCTYFSGLHKLLPMTVPDGRILQLSHGPQ